VAWSGRASALVSWCAAALAGLVATGCAGTADEPPAERVESGELALTCLDVQRTSLGGTQVADAQIWSDVIDPNRGNTNFGSVAVMTTGVSITDVRRVLLWFDLSSIPAESIVSYASLSLRMLQSPGKAPVNVHAVLAPWSEATVTWNALGGAFDPTIEASFATLGVVNNTTLVVDVTGLAARWVSGALPNHGLMLDHPTPGRTALGSSEAPTVAPRPSLHVCYALPTCCDGVQNQGETGVDCGGPCPICPTCSDGLQNQGELAIDCGGPCAACVHTCGNGIVEPGEACDDGNAVDGDGCNAGCIAAGTLLWSVTYTPPAGDARANAVDTDAQGNIFVTGAAWNGTDEDIFVRKYAADGALLWTRSWAGLPGFDDSGQGIAVDATGGAVVVGSTDTADEDIIVLRYAADGTQTFSVMLDPSGSHDYGYAAAVDASGNILVAGSTTKPGGYDAYLAKLTPAGVPVWGTTYGSVFPGDDLFTGVAVDPTGAIVAAGLQTSAGSTYDLLAARYGSGGGAPLWTRTFGALGTWEYALGVATDASSSVLVAGVVPSAGQDDGWLRKYASTGATLWTATYAGAAGGPDATSAVACDAVGNVLVAGYETGVLGETDAWVQKRTAAGALSWTATYAGAAALGDRALGVAALPTGDVIVVGDTHAGGLVGSAWVARYAQ
jgi:uncharacterized delta-60 repeat protein